MKNSIPPTGPVLDWLRSEAHQPFIQSSGDDGEYVPLQWLLPLIDEDARIVTAIIALLGEGDKSVTVRLLQLAAFSDAPLSLRAAVARVIGRQAGLLAQMDVSDDQTALGLAVYAMWPPVPLTDETLNALHDISRPQDGWPLSVRIGIVVDLPRFADRAVSDFDKMTDPEQGQVLLGMLTRGGDAVTGNLLELISKSGSAALKSRVAHSLKATLDDLDEARKMVVASGAQPTGEASSTRWPRLAARLGVQP